MNLMSWSVERERERMHHNGVDNGEKTMCCQIAGDENSSCFSKR